MSLKIFLRNALLLMWIFLSGINSANGTTSEIVLVGCTPGDEDIKSTLAIPSDTKIDFIRWNLKLESPGTFVLDVAYGESQPNTLDFKNGGKKRSLKGMFTISKNTGNLNFKEVYILKDPGLVKSISLVKLNENVFHLLTSQNHLMIGNGGWSYSLNRESPVNSNEILISSTISNKKSLQLIFHGRTPCREFAADHAEMKVSNSCFKLKWRLILNRDSVTYLPTTYAIRKVVDGKARMISGKWTEIIGADANPDAIIYKIEPEKPDESISFLVGDDNVLFFLNKKNELYVGNKNFSFTLNKKL